MLEAINDVMTILASAQNGNYFAGVAKACGMSTGEAKSGLEKLCPAIAAQLKAKAQNDHEAFEALLDLLDEGGGSTDLDDLTEPKPFRMARPYWKIFMARPPCWPK